MPRSLQGNGPTAFETGRKIMAAWPVVATSIAAGSSAVATAAVHILNAIVASYAASLSRPGAKRARALEEHDDFVTRTMGGGVRLGARPHPAQRSQTFEKAASLASRLPGRQRGGEAYPAGVQPGRDPNASLAGIVRRGR